MTIKGKLKNGFLAGLFGVAINTMALKAAHLFGIEAEAGGVLRLLRQTFGAIFDQIGITGLWAGLHLPMPGSGLFWLAFHAGMGIGMAIFYALALEPYLPGPGWLKGFLFGLLPWILNSAIVLPLLGKGFAASQALTWGGLIYFFFANQLYGVLVGVVYERLKVLFSPESV